MPTRLQDDMMKHPFLDEIEIGLNDCETTGTLENILSWSIYESEKGIKMGIIRLSSFTPVGGPAQTINLIRNLIVNELVETDCLLIDVRNNGGYNLLIKWSDISRRRTSSTIF